jgi:hypothetical protein
MTVPAANALINWSPYFRGLVVVGRFNGSVILGAQLDRKFYLNDDKVNRHLVQPRTAILPNYCSSFDYRYGCLNVWLSTISLRRRRDYARRAGLAVSQNVTLCRRDIVASIPRPLHLINRVESLRHRPV